MSEIKAEDEKLGDKHQEWIKENIFKPMEDILLKYRELIITIWGVLCLIVSKAVIFNYKQKCEAYYNVSMQYFDGQQRLEDVEIFGILTVLLIIYPIIIFIIRHYFDDKKGEIMTFIALSCVFFYQSLTYDEYIMQYSDSDFLRKIAASWITIGILFVADLFVSFFLVWKNKGKKIISNIVVTISLMIIVINALFGIFAGLNFNVENKKEYEILDSGKSAVISTYEGMFVVMDCQIYGDNEYLYLDNKNYRLEEMAGHNIQYIMFDSVGFDRPSNTKQNNCSCQ